MRRLFASSLASLLLVTIVLSDISAALFWESHSLEGPNAPRRIMTPRDPGAPSARAITKARSLSVFAPDECIHVLVGSQGNRRTYGGLKCHSCSFAFPSGSFFRIDDEILVTSPELTFVQMAQRLSFEHLVHFGMMLCGIYAREPNGHSLLREEALSADIGQGSFEAMPLDHQRVFLDSRRRLCRRLPLTVPEDLRSYAEQVVGLNGVSAAMRAASDVIGQSRSPMESALAIAMCLPYKFGGYKLSRPNLNYAVYVEDSGMVAGGARRDVHGKPYFECDLVWPDSKVIVEYHGDDGHFTREGVAKDARKANILMREGYSFFTATLETFSSSFKFKEFAHGVREKVGKRFQCRIADFDKRGTRLRAALRDDYLQRLRFEDACRCYKVAK